MDALLTSFALWMNLMWSFETWMQQMRSFEIWVQLMSHLKQRCSLMSSFSPIAPRMAKIAYNFGLSECNRVKT